MDFDPLDDFELAAATYDGTTKDVYRKGTGPGVVVITEIPGITPQVAHFARHVVDAGFTVAVPVVFGTPGKPLSGPYAMKSIVGACISREFVCFATGRTSPVTRWLRGLALDLHAECGGPGVGAVGMCLTGGFALAMMVDDVLAAPVLSQPSLPLPVSRSRKRDLGLSPDDLERVKERVAAGCPVLGLRFTADRFVPAERFQRLRDELGDGFLAVEIDSSKGNPHGIPRTAHSVLTKDLVEEPGHPTLEARQRVIEFLRERLGG